MLQKRYGKCKILGEDNFEFFIEYKYKYTDTKGYGNYDNFAMYIVGKDIVTGTSLYSLLPSYDISNLKDAARMKAISKRKLIIKKYKEISTNDMIDFLDKITDEELIKYISKVNEIKKKYSNEIYKEKCESKKEKDNKKVENNNLRIKKEKVRSLKKELI